MCPFWPFSCWGKPSLRPWRFFSVGPDSYNVCRLASQLSSEGCSERQSGVCISSPLLPCCAVPSRTDLCHVVLCHPDSSPPRAVLCCAVPCRVVPCHTIPCRVVLSRPVPCCAIPCNALPCSAVPYRTVSCHAPPCSDAMPHRAGMPCRTLR